MCVVLKEASQWGGMKGKFTRARQIFYQNGPQGFKWKWRLFELEANVLTDIVLPQKFRPFEHPYLYTNPPPCWTSERRDIIPGGGSYKPRRHKDALLPEQNQYTRPTFTMSTVVERVVKGRNKKGCSVAAGKTRRERKDTRR